MTQTLKNNWQLLSWRVCCIVLIALLHNWAMASLLTPPKLSSSAGKKGPLSVAVQFTQATSASQHDSVTDSFTQAQPKAATNKIVKQIQAKPQTDTPVTTKNTPTKLVESPRLVAKKKPSPPATEAETETETKLEQQQPAPQPSASNSHQAASGGAHQQPVITEPLFVEPPTPPRYPTIARKRGQQGTVWLDIWLDDEGKQAKLAIAQSSGLKVLDESALKAVSQWHFQAYRIGGIRMAARVRIPVEFSLN